MGSRKSPLSAGANWSVEICRGCREWFPGLGHGTMGRTRPGDRKPIFRLGGRIFRRRWRDGRFSWAVGPLIGPPRRRRSPPRLESPPFSRRRKWRVQWWRAGPVKDMDFDMAFIMKTSLVTFYIDEKQRWIEFMNACCVAAISFLFFIVILRICL